MDKVSNFYQRNKKVLLGILAVSTAGILSFYAYNQFVVKNKKVPRPKTTKTHNSPQKLPIITKKKTLSEKELLNVIASIKKMCNENLKALRNRYRIERRKVFYDEEAYQQLIEDYDSKLLQILEITSEKIFQQHKITQEIFDEAVRTYIDDEEISSAVDSMATVEEECEAPPHVTKELLLEIFNYNNKRSNEAVFESNKNFEYLNTRIQDEIYFKYKIEIEELSACYKKFNCENDPDFQPKIDEMQKSVNTYLNS